MVAYCWRKECRLFPVILCSILNVCTINCPTLLWWFLQLFQILGPNSQIQRKVSWLHFAQIDRLDRRTKRLLYVIYKDVSTSLRIVADWLTSIKLSISKYLKLATHAVDRGSHIICNAKQQTSTGRPQNNLANHIPVGLVIQDKQFVQAT